MRNDEWVCLLITCYACAYKFKMIFTGSVIQYDMIIILLLCNWFVMEQRNAMKLI